MSPWAVTDWLYAIIDSGPVPGDRGTHNWARMSNASTPPNARKSSEVMMYRIPTSLWLVVTNHRRIEFVEGNSWPVPAAACPPSVAVLVVESSAVAVSAVDSPAVSVVDDAVPSSVGERSSELMLELGQSTPTSGWVRTCWPTSGRGQTCSRTTDRTRQAP